MGSSMSRRGRGDGAIFYDEERSRWVGLLDLGVGADGRRLRRKAVGPTKSAVAGKLRKLREEHDGRPSASSGNLILAQLAERWIDTAVLARHPVGSSMWETYRYIVDHHINPRLGSTMVRRLSAEDVDRTLRAMAADGYSRSTVRRTRNTLSQILRWGIRRRICTWDPAALAELPPATVYDKAKPRVTRIPRALHAEEVRKLLGAFENDEDRTLVLVAVSTALRPGEVTALLWDDVDLELGSIHVRRAWKGRDEHRRIGEPKTMSSVRRIALSTRALEALVAMKARRIEQPRPAEWAELVFTSTTGTPIHPANLRRLIRDAATRAGIGHVAPYDLRHTGASLLSDAGVPNHELADLLGHTTTRMVEIHYRHRLREVIDVAAAPMDDILSDD